MLSFIFVLKLFSLLLLIEILPALYTKMPNLSCINESIYFYTWWFSKIKSVALLTDITQINVRELFTQFVIFMNWLKLSLFFSLSLSLRTSLFWCATCVLNYNNKKWNISCGKYGVTKGKNRIDSAKTFL